MWPEFAKKIQKICYINSEMADEWCTLSRLCMQHGKNTYTDQSSLFCHAMKILCLELNFSVKAVAGTAIHNHRICDELAIAYLDFTGLICSFLQCHF